MKTDCPENKHSVTATINLKGCHTGTLMRIKIAATIEQEDLPGSVSLKTNPTNHMCNLMLVQ